jgi:hypothetical protein
MITVRNEFLVQKKSLSGHKFQDDREEQSYDNIGWPDIDWEQKRSSHDMTNGSDMAGTKWKCSGRAEELNVDCSY